MPRYPWDNVRYDRLNQGKGDEVSPRFLFFQTCHPQGMTITAPNRHHGRAERIFSPPLPSRHTKHT